MIKMYPPSSNINNEASNKKPLMNATNFGVEAIFLCPLTVLSIGQDIIGGILQQGDFMVIP